MEALFEGLTESEIRYLLYLNEHGYYDGFEMFLNEDTSSDYRVDKLYKNGYITLDESGSYPGSQSVTLTGKGVAAIRFTQPFSKSFGSFEEIKKNFFSKTPSEDLNDSLHELTENGFLYDIPINDVTHKYELSNHAIATLEAIPKEAILSLAKFIPNLFL